MDLFLRISIAIIICKSFFQLSSGHAPASGFTYTDFKHPFDIINSDDTVIVGIYLKNTTSSTIYNLDATLQVPDGAGLALLRSHVLYDVLIPGVSVRGDFLLATSNVVPSYYKLNLDLGEFGQEEFYVDVISTHLIDTTAAIFRDNSGTYTTRLELRPPTDAMTAAWAVKSITVSYVPNSPYAGAYPPLRNCPCNDISRSDRNGRILKPYGYAGNEMRVYVVDCEGKPIPDADVTLDLNEPPTKTEGDGIASFPLPSKGPHMIWAGKAGYDGNGLNIHTAEPGEYVQSWEIHLNKQPNRLYMVIKKELGSLLGGELCGEAGAAIFSLIPDVGWVVDLAGCIGGSIVGEITGHEIGGDSTGDFFFKGRFHSVPFSTERTIAESLYARANYLEEPLPWTDWSAEIDWRYIRITDSSTYEFIGQETAQNPRLQILSNTDKHIYHVGDTMVISARVRYPNSSHLTGRDALVHAYIADYALPHNVISDAIVLTDDGRNGDETPNDGLYTARHVFTPADSAGGHLQVVVMAQTTFAYPHIGLYVTDVNGALLFVNKGWNMISPPLIVGNDSVKVQYPNAATDYAFAYVPGYQVRYRTENGSGYWLKYSSKQHVSITGSPIPRDTIQASEGWNMIGSLSEPIQVGTITSDPPGTITSQLYGYNGSYVSSDTIFPGKAYWVKVNHNCKLMLSSAGTGLAKTSTARIHIVPTSELPPPPPDGALSTVKNIPHEYALEQAYPSPFNPSTTIRYQLPQDGRVSLLVYNSLGQVVAVLVDGIQQAGYKQVEWNAGSVASGIYFYRLEATSISDPSKTFTQVKKMILLR